MFKSKRQRILEDVLIDLHDYEGTLLMQMDARMILEPPPSLPGGPDYDSLRPSDMDRIKHNRRVALELHRRISKMAGY